MWLDISCRKIRILFEQFNLQWDNICKNSQMGVSKLQNVSDKLKDDNTPLVDFILEAMGTTTRTPSQISK